ncbi:MAG TPA: polyphosphate kinase 2 family protein [Nocardioidaceae bacterium]|nr:polyphosphate kinase 2 family protein [Nocardioidaceae bacterium]
MAEAGKKKDAGTRMRDLLRVGKGFALLDVDTSATPGFDGGKSAGKRALAEGEKPLADLQERLFAEARGGGERSLLLLIQGMDTSGKGGIMRHVVGAVDPQGVDLTAFKKPTEEELEHSFLWRVRNALPRPGQIGVFDRSHYEDVLVARVHGDVPEKVWRARYDEINEFEADVVAGGTPIVKVMLHISAGEQKQRLLRRLDRPDKHWKFDPGDLDEREHWEAYQAAYQDALTSCSTEPAPWYVVPADRKWYARLAVQHLLLGALRDMDPKWPVADFDVEAERARLLAT